MERFWNKVDKNGPINNYKPELGKCWVWKTARSYAHFIYKGMMIPAHRFSYELVKGPIPKNLVIDHLCRTPRCVNPNHLEPVTMKENTLRGFGTGAQNFRKNHCLNGHELIEENLAKLTDTNRRLCKICVRQRGAKFRKLNPGYASWKNKTIAQKKRSNERVREWRIRNPGKDSAYASKSWSQLTPEQREAYRIKARVWRVNNPPSLEQKKKRSMMKKIYRSTHPSTPEQRERRKLYMREFRANQKMKNNI